MGQRFQILVEIDNNLFCYHSQWLCGAYAIRRLGSVVWAIQQRKKFSEYFRVDGEIDRLVNWGFTYNLKDQNSVDPYFNISLLHNKDLKEYETIEDFLESLDNNNGQFYLKIKENKIIGYAFFNPKNGYNEAKEENKGKLIGWKEYMEDYKDGLIDEFAKSQKKEFDRGTRVFNKLKVLTKFPDIKEFLI